MSKMMAVRFLIFLLKSNMNNSSDGLSAHIFYPCSNEVDLLGLGAQGQRGAEEKKWGKKDDRIFELRNKIKKHHQI